MTCITCGHTDPHTGGGIGVCLAPDCGCDGPVTVADKAAHDRMWDEWNNPHDPVIRVSTSRSTAFIAVVFLAMAAVALLLVAFVDAVSDHEVPADLPDCEEDEVLYPTVYDADPDERVYECRYDPIR